MFKYIHFSYLQAKSGQLQPLAYTGKGTKEKAIWIKSNALDIGWNKPSLILQCFWLQLYAHQLEHSKQVKILL